jgi:hypothetical protein
MILPRMFANRYRAGAVYLAASMVVAMAVFTLIYFVWYPRGLFKTVGGVDLFLLIALVQVVVGPLLVTIIFRPGKAGLAFDLAAIAVLQLAALGYGLHVLYLSRPAYVVFVKDRFELVRANDIPDSERRKATRYRDLPIFGPRIVGARLPGDPGELSRIMFAALGGVDLQHFPQHYVDYDNVRAEVLARAGRIARLRELNRDVAAKVDRLLGRIGRPENEIAFVPFKADKRELAALIDAKNADLITVAPLRPWN